MMTNDGSGWLLTISNAYFFSLFGNSLSSLSNMACGNCQLCGRQANRHEDNHDTSSQRECGYWLAALSWLDTAHISHIHWDIFVDLFQNQGSWEHPNFLWPVVFGLMWCRTAGLLEPGLPPAKGEGVAYESLADGPWVIRDCWNAMIRLLGHDPVKHHRWDGMISKALVRWCMPQIVCSISIQIPV